MEAGFHGNSSPVPKEAIHALTKKSIHKLIQWFDDYIVRNLPSLFDFKSWSERLQLALVQNEYDNLTNLIADFFSTMHTHRERTTSLMRDIGLPSDSYEHVNDSFSIAVRLNLPPCFSKAMEIYYEQSWRLFDSLRRSIDMEEVAVSDIFASLARKDTTLDPFITSAFEDSIEMDNDYEYGSEGDPELDLETLRSELDQFDRTCEQARELGFIKTRLLEPLFTNVLFRQIEQRLESTTKDQFEEPLLRTSLKWLRSSMNWIRRIGGTGFDLRTWYTRLAFHLIKTFAHMRLKELFDIVLYYPDSVPALEDLKTCIDLIDLDRNELVDTFRESCERRLLQPGPDTSDIITTYISTVKALRPLDPSGVLLDKVSEPIRKYLRFRDDTVRVLVCGLMADESASADLVEELSNAEVVPLDRDDEYDNMEGGDDWMPIPKDAGPNRTLSRSHDIVSLLVGMFDSREIFIKEYQNLLADRLLAMTDFDTSKEVRNVELLKIRFGEASLQVAEVMLKDMADSRRLAFAEEEAVVSPKFQATVLSKLFWPAIRQDDVVLPSEIRTMMDAYEGKFREVKQARRLQWLHQLGRVTVEVELEDGREMEVVCSPIQAAIIHAFESTTTMNASDLETNLQVSAEVLRLNLDFWIVRSVLRQDGNVVSVQEHMPTTSVLVATTTEQSTVAGDSARVEMEMYWSYIQGMLTNLGALPLGRIQNMLAMFVTEPSSYTRTEEELEDFLERLVREDKLDKAAGNMYKLKA